MKHVATLFLLLALCGCVPSRTTDSRRIVPRIPAEASGLADPGIEEAQSRERDPQPRISIDERDAVLSVLEENLDLDPDVEQVVAVKRRGDVSSPVRILMADSDSRKGRYYYQSWEESTEATSTRIFALALKDLVGDHGTEIVASGMNAEGKLTLDVFRKAALAAGQGTSFQNVCRIVADDIKIEETPRAEAYSSDKKNGESFPIIAYNRDPDSRNVMDLIRVTYSWRYMENRYSPGLPEHVPGEKVVQERLEALYTSVGTADFEKFLDGAWAQLPTAVSTAPPAHPSEIIVFEPTRRKISRFLGDTEEFFTWSESLRTLYDRILAFTENDSVRTISRTFSIRANTNNTLEISIQGSDLGDVTSGTYVRLSDDASAGDTSPIVLRASSLEGAYQSPKGLRISFQGRRLTWAEDGTSRPGVFVLFSLNGGEIMSIRFFDDNDLPVETRSFLVTFGEKRELNRTLKTLALIPVQLTVGGILETSDEPIGLERLEDPVRK